MKAKFVRKLVVMTACAVMSLTLFTACGDDADSNQGGSSSNGGQSGEKTPAATQGAETPSDGGYTFTYKGTTISMKEDMETVKAALGEPASYFESESCAFQGMDKVFTYGSVVITTYPDGDKDYVYSIELKDDTVETPEKICIGSAKSAVSDAYGAPSSETDTAYVYTKGSCNLTFIFADDAVTGITYVAKTE